MHSSLIYKTTHQEALLSFISQHNVNSIQSRGNLLSPAEEADYLTLVKLEALAFDNDDFTLVAFGTERHSPEK